MSKVQELIAAKRAHSPRQIQLPPAVMADLKEVLRSNDRESRIKCRVSLDEFLKHAKTAHKFAASAGVILRICKELGRTSWGQK